MWAQIILAAICIMLGIAALIVTAINLMMAANADAFGVRGVFTIWPPVATVAAFGAAVAILTNLPVS